MPYHSTKKVSQSSSKDDAFHAARVTQKRSRHIPNLPPPRRYQYRTKQSGRAGSP